MNNTQIKELRKRLDLSQADFAHKIGVTLNTVQRWEHGTNKPSRLGKRALREFLARGAC